MQPPLLRGSRRTCEVYPPPSEVPLYQDSEVTLQADERPTVVRKKTHNPQGHPELCNSAKLSMWNIPNFAIPQSTSHRIPELRNSSRNESRKLSLAHDAQDPSVPASWKTTRDWMAMRQAL